MVNFCENFYGAQVVVFSICALQFINPSIPMNPFKFSVIKTVSIKCCARTRRPAQLFGVLGLGLLVAACGGGGGGDASPAADPAPTSTTLTPLQAEQVIIQTAVFLHDGVAGFLRMLDLAGVTRLTGQPGQVTVACPGGGSLTTNKLAVPTPGLTSSVPTVFNMTANQCRFSSRDGLVYHGVWAVEASPSTITYSPSGACAVTCSGGNIAVRTQNATYGYGVADNPAPPLLYSLNSANGAHFFFNFFTGTPLVEGNPRLSIFSGNQTTALPLAAAGMTFEGALALVDHAGSSIRSLGTVVAVSGPRSTLRITQPFSAALQLSDAGVTAVVESYGTMSRHTSSFPWSEFLN